MTSEITADVVVDLQYGDCGKGKVTHHLARTRNYTHVLRYNGGCNAGHTIVHEGQEFVTHHIPAGVFFGIKSIIGPGCVLSLDQFFDEIEMLKEGGIDPEGMIFVAKNTHIITERHIIEDGKDDEIGTTGRGNGPAYRDKYERSGKRAEDVEDLEPYLIDVYQEFHHNGEVRVLCEGAQGFGLDINWGDYPYVTSSHCTVAGALLNAIPYSSVREVWGVAKSYETYVGAKDFEPDTPIFDEIREAGNEFGSTTGRPRQVNWMDWNLVEKAIRINDVTDIVFNKMDILREVGEWSILVDGKEFDFDDEKSYKEFILMRLAQLGYDESRVNFSGHKDRI